MNSYSLSNWMHIDNSNSNLPDNHITDIAQSNTGEIWVSTYQGFAKYVSQNSWEVYHNPNATSNDVCLAITTQDSIVWVATVNGLVRYCNGNITVYDPTNSALGAYFIYSLTVQNNILWIGTGDYGVYEFDGISFVNYSYSNSGNSPLGNIYSIDIDGSGTKWFTCKDARPIADNSHSIVSFDDTNWSLFDTANSGAPTYSEFISIDGLDNKWITDVEGHVVKFDGLQWNLFDSSNISYKPIFQPSRVSFDASGNKWISTQRGFAKFDDMSWTFFDSTNSFFPLYMDQCRNIFIDSLNNKFICTNGYGLLIFNENGIAANDEILNIEKNQISVSGNFINKLFVSNIKVDKFEIVSCTLINLEGQIIAKQSLSCSPMTPNGVVFDFNSLVAGHYLLIYRSGRATKILKVIYI